MASPAPTEESDFEMIGDGHFLTHHLIRNLANQMDNQAGGIEAHLPDGVNPMEDIHPGKTTTARGHVLKNAGRK